MQHWTRVCGIGDIPRLGARVLRRGEGTHDVAVFRTADDRLFALLDRCPHRGGPLSQGIVYGERVACPLHNTNVELESGNAVAPDKGCVRTFPVKLEQGVVYVDLESAVRAEPFDSAVRGERNDVESNHERQRSGQAARDEIEG